MDLHASILKVIFEDQKANDGKIRLEAVLKIIPLLLYTEKDYKEYVLLHESFEPKMQKLLKNQKFSLFFGSLIFNFY